MATFVQATTGFNSSGSNTNLFTNNFGSACTAGNALIIAVFMDSATATISGITDTATVHNTYTQLATFASGFGTIWLYQALNITDNSGTVYQVQVTEGTALDGQITVQEWSGFATSGNILDVSRTDSGTSANPTTSGTLTTNQSNEVIFSLLMLQASSNTYSAGSGYSNVSSLASSFTSAGMESAALAAASGTTAGFGMTNMGTSYIQLTAGLLTTASTPLGAVLSPHPLLMKLSLADSRQHVPIIRGFASQVTYTPQLYIQDLSAGVSFSGSFGPTQTNKSLTAVLSFSGDFVKQALKVLNAGVSPNNLVPNGGFESAPQFIAATTANTVWIDGTAAGSTANGDWRWGINKGGTTAARFDNTVFNSGSSSLKLSTTAAASFVEARQIIGTTTLALLQTGAIPALASTTYKLTYYLTTTLNSGSATTGARMEVRQYNSSGTLVATVPGTNTVTSIGWTQFTVNFTSNSTAAYFLIVPTVKGSDGSATLVMDAWFDDISLTPTAGSLLKQTGKSLAAALSFTGAIPRTVTRAFSAALNFVGNFIGSKVGGTNYTQTLTAGLSFTGAATKSVGYPLAATASFTGSLAKLIRRPLFAGIMVNNLLPNGNFEVAPPSIVTDTSTSQRWIDGSAVGSTDSAAFGWATTSIGAGGQAGFDSSNAHSGTYSLHLSTTNTTATLAVATYRLTGGPSAYMLFTLQPGTSYTITGWIKTNNVPTNSVFIDFREYNASLTALATTSSTKLSGTNGWTQVIYTVTANASTAYGTILVRINIAGNICDAWFDDITVEPTNGILTRQVNRLLAATVSFTGSMAKGSARAFTATLSFAGSLAKGHLFSQAFTASLSFTGTFGPRNITKRLLGYLSFVIPPDQTGGGLGSGYYGGTYYGQGYTGPLPSAFTKTTLYPLAASVSFAGSALRFITYPLAASLSFAGTLPKRLGRVLTPATLSLTGLFTKTPQKALTAVLSFSGTITRAVRVVFSGTLSFSGALLKQSLALFSGGVSFAGSIRRSVVAVLSAAVSFTGNFVTAKSGLFTMAFTASVGFTGAIAKSSRRSLAAILTVNFGAAIPVARHIQSTFSSGSGSSATLNISATGTSNFLVIGLRLFASGGPKTITVTDNASIPNTYALAGSELLNDTNNNSVYQLYGVQITGGATQITLSWTGSFTYVALADEFSGTAASNAAVFDATSMTNSNNVAQTSSAAPAFSPASDGELIVANIAANGAVGTPVAGNGYTLGAIDSTGIKAFQQYKLSSSGAETAPASWDLNTTWGEIATAYKLRQPTLFPLVKSTGKALNGGLSFVGAIAKSTSHAVFFIATLGFTGSIGRTTRRSLTATVSPAGAGAKQVRLPLAAAVSMTSSIGKRTGRVLSAAVSFSGSIGRVMSRSFRASVGLIGSLLSLIRSPFLPTNTINLSQNDNTVDLSQSDTETVTLSQEDESNDVFL